MKTIIFSFFAVLLITGCTPPMEEIDVTKEEVAIMAVLEEELKLFLNRDYNAEAEFVKSADYVRTINNSGNFHNQTVGWDSIFVDLKRFSEQEGWQHTTNLNLEMTDFNIKVYNEVAWAVYNLHNTWEYKGEPYDTKQSRVTFLEKVDGQWKIVLMTTTLLNPCEEEEEDEDDDD